MYRPDIAGAGGLPLAHRPSDDRARRAADRLAAAARGGAAGYTRDEDRARAARLVRDRDGRGDGGPDIDVSRTRSGDGAGGVVVLAELQEGARTARPRVRGR